MMQHQKIKVTLVSEDSGKTWFVSRVFYASGADNPHQKFKFLDLDQYEKLVLETVE